MTIIGLLAVAMSVRFTPDQQFAMLSVNPKGFLFNTPWLPAPPNFRILGVVLLMLGIASVLFSRISSRNTKARTVD
jgi:hypothetical protein